MDWFLYDNGHRHERVNYVYQLCACLLQLDKIHGQSAISHLVFKETIFILNQCFDLVVKPRGSF